MSKNEDYLDDLLNSVSGRNDKKDITDLLNTVREGEERTNRERENRRRRRDFGTQLYREFEQELSHPDAEDNEFISNFNLELDAEEAAQQMDDFPEKILEKKERQTGSALSDEELIANINGIVGEAKKRVEGYQEDEPEIPDDAARENFSLGEEAMEPEEELKPVEEPELTEEEPLAEEPEEQIIDEDKLSDADKTDGDDDLLNMLTNLSEDSDLSDIGEMLKADEEGTEVAAEEGNEFEKLESIEELSGISDAKNGKKKAKKKQKKDGAFSHFLNVLFGEDEKAAQTKVSEEGTLGNIGDENLEILKELDASGETTEKKPKKKKEKEKKPKDKKPKPKKVKAPKPKKEKKPKEPDMSPPLPKKPVILISVMAASIFLLILLGGDLSSYAGDISTAKEDYRNGNYVEAYTAISGRKVKNADQALYNKCAVMAMVEEQYRAYLSLMQIGQYEMALDSLVRGIGRYDKYYEKADEYGILLEYNELEAKIEQVLGEQFSVTADEARELYQLRERDEYSIGIRNILENLELE